MIIHSKRRGSKFWKNVVNISLVLMLVVFAIVVVALGKLSEAKQAPPEIINMRLGDGVTIDVEEIVSHVRLRWENRSLNYSVWIERQNSEYMEQIIIPSHECLRYCSLVMELPAGTYYWRVIFFDYKTLVNEVEIDWFTLR